MRYSVWSRGRFVGETELGYARFRPTLRVGDFFPSDEGQKVMPVATGASAVARNRDSDPEIEYADLASAYDRCEALAFELRGADGRAIATEWIAIRDTELIRSFLSDDELAGEDFTLDYDPELEAEMQHDLELINEWFANDGDDLDLEYDRCDWMDPPEFPRYQIMVELCDPAAVP